MGVVRRVVPVTRMNNSVQQPAAQEIIRLLPCPRRFIDEIPPMLEKLLRMAMQGLYSIREQVVIDMVIKHTCIMQEELCELLAFERKQLNDIVQHLVNQKMLEVRSKPVTNEEVQQSYVFINYKDAVNTIRYKMHAVRVDIVKHVRVEAIRRQREFFRMLCQQNDGAEIDITTVGTCPLQTFNEDMQPLTELLNQTGDMIFAHQLLNPKPQILEEMHEKSNELVKSQKNHQLEIAQRPTPEKTTLVPTNLVPATLAPSTSMSTNVHSDFKYQMKISYLRATKRRGTKR